MRVMSRTALHAREGGTDGNVSFVSVDARWESVVISLKCAPDWPEFELQLKRGGRLSGIIHEGNIAQSLRNLDSILSKAGAGGEAELEARDVARLLGTGQFDANVGMDQVKLLTQLGHIANKLGKWKPADGRARLFAGASWALAWVGHQVSRLRLEGIEAKAISMLLNSMGKLPDNEDCRSACMSLAQYLASDDGKSVVTRMNAQNVANSLNALGKWPDCHECRDAAARLASRLERDETLRQSLNAQNVANSLHALGKWPDRDECRNAAMQLALRLELDDTLRRSLNPQNVANSLNALGKWPDRDECRNAAAQLALHLQRDDELQQSFNAQNVANSLNALGKWADRIECQYAAVQLALRLVRDEALRESLNAQNVANSLYALSKWPDRVECRDAAMQLALRLNRDEALRNSLNSQNVANSLNALGKWPDRQECQEATVQLALRLAREDALLQSLSAQNVTSSLDALAKWPDRHECRDAAVKLALYEIVAVWKHINLVTGTVTVATARTEPTSAHTTVQTLHSGSNGRVELPMTGPAAVLRIELLLDDTNDKRADCGIDLLAHHLMARINLTMVRSSD